MSLNVTTEIEGSKATLNVEGRLAYDSAPDLDHVITKLPGTVRDIVCNLSRVNYVSSAGLRVFVHAMRIANSRKGTFVITQPSDEAYNVFRMTGLDDVVTIER